MLPRYAVPAAPSAPGPPSAPIDTSAPKPESMDMKPASGALPLLEVTHPAASAPAARSNTHPTPPSRMSFAMVGYVRLRHVRDTLSFDQRPARSTASCVGWIGMVS